MARIQSLDGLRAVLRPFRRIVVTGPQRSGTRFATKVIAKELGLQFVDERDYGVHFLDRFLEALQDGRVVHAPGVSQHCHRLPEDVAVVFVWRSLAEILASQRRIQWAFEAMELRKYWDDPDLRPYMAVWDVTDAVEPGTSARNKQLVWSHYQRPHVRHAFDLEYAAFEAHPDWVPREQRQGFHFMQTALDDPAPTAAD